MTIKKLFKYEVINCNFPLILTLHLAGPRLGGLKRLHEKILFRQRGIPVVQKRESPCQDETFHMQLQDTIYEEFITLPGSRQNGTEFYPSRPGSCNHHLILPCYLLMQFAQV